MGQPIVVAFRFRTDPLGRDYFARKLLQSVLRARGQAEGSSPIHKSAPEIATNNARLAAAVASSAAILAAGFVASGITGYLRDAFIAAYLGATGQADAFVIAYTWLDVLVGNVGPALMAVVVPSLLSQQDSTRRRRLAASVVALVGLFSLCAAGAIAALSPALTSALAPGLPPASHQLALAAMRWMSPAVMMLTISGAAIAILSARMRFLGPVASTSLYNLLIVGGTLLVPRFGVQGLAIAVTSASCVQLTLLLILLLRRGLLAVPDVSGVRAALKLLLAFTPVFVGTLISYSGFFIDRRLASELGSGAVVEFNYALRIGVMTSQVAGTALASAAFPVVAAAIARGDRLIAAASLRSVLRFSLMANLAVVFIVLPWRSELVSVLYQHGKFGSVATETASQVLGFLILGTAADGVSQALWRLVFSLGRTTLFVLVNFLQLVAHLASLGLFVPRLGLNGIGLAVTVGLIIQLGLLLVVSSRSMTGLLPRPSELRSVIRYGAASCPLIVTSIAGSVAATQEPQSLHLAMFVASVTLGFVLTVLIAVRLHLSEVAALQGRLTDYWLRHGKSGDLA